MSDSARDWVVKLTVSKPDTAEREMARRALEAYFARTSSEQAVRNFLDLAVGASPRQKRILADLVAPYVTVGASWRTLLYASERRWARRAARARLALWDDEKAGESLYIGFGFATAALATRDDGRCLSFLVELALETVQRRPHVPLRPVERHLHREAKWARGKPGWRRKPYRWHGVLQAAHDRISQALAPPDTPLTSLAPTLGADGLPIPSEGSATSAANLPTPATPGAVDASQPWWKRWIKRFRR